jgi:hypothetical protein
VTIFLSDGFTDSTQTWDSSLVTKRSVRTQTWDITIR